MSEKEYIDDVLLVVDKKAKSIITQNNGAILYDEIIEPYLNQYEPGEKVNLLIYGNPRKVRCVKKSVKEKEAVIKKRITEAAIDERINKRISDKNKKELGYIFLNGKWYATLRVLLNKLHELYPNRNRIKTEAIEIDRKEKTAIFKTTVEIIDSEGKVMGEYQGIGDADSTNVNSNILTAFIRMAETRSIVRALRWATNIAETAIDEMPSEDKDFYNSKKAITKNKK